MGSDAQYLMDNGMDWLVRGEIPASWGQEEKHKSIDITQNHNLAEKKADFIRKLNPPSEVVSIIDFFI